MNLFKRILFGIIFTTIIVYLIFLMINGINFVNEAQIDQRTIIFILYIIIFAYYLIFYVAKPTYIKKYKLRNTLIGIFVITASHSFLANDPIQKIYFADIFTVIGIFLTIIGPTNLLISKKQKQKQQEKKMEVIEA
ncbi:MAG TPA: hypothetical protein P5060_00375 [Candidatus Absconditabacterales bacterium]|nr:hypothetical protein [Candidatus Absconditabacterales bacterium]